MPPGLDLVIKSLTSVLKWINLSSLEMVDSQEEIIIVSEQQSYDDVCHGAQDLAHQPPG